MNLENKHDHLCDLVATELKERGWVVIKDLNYRATKSGQIDVFGRKGDYFLDVEVKCNDGKSQRKHAYDQLDRAVKYFEPYIGRRVFKMYAYYTNDGYKLEWIKNE